MSWAIPQAVIVIVTLDGCALDGVTNVTDGGTDKALLRKLKLKHPTSARNPECSTENKGNFTEIQKLLNEDEIYNFVGSYHAHSSLHADEEEECEKEEKQTDNFENNC